MKRISLAKTFVTVTLIILCTYVLFFGIRFAKINTERSLKNTQNSVIDETQLIKGISEELGKIFSAVK